MPARRTLPASAVLIALLAALLTGCATDEPIIEPQYYVALGDSYAVGYQPPSNGGGSSTDGYPWIVERKSRATARPLELVDFGCAGITSETLVSGRPCAKAARAVDAPDPGDGSQLDAALDFLEEHAEEIGLVTVHIGGNDVQLCLVASERDACLADAVEAVDRNVSTIVDRLRDAVGEDVAIIGLTYPNVFLAAPYVDPGAASTATAKRARTLFRDELNPVLREAYNSRGAEFIDVTALAGGYLPDSDTIVNEDGRTVPTSIDNICRYTHFCAERDVHLNKRGNADIADEVMRVWPVS